MVFKVNYGLERAERNRVKQAKKEAKLRDRKASAAQASMDATPDGVAMGADIEIPPTPTED